MDRYLYFVAPNAGSSTTKLPCDECGTMFDIRYSVIRSSIKRGSTQYYCSRSCNGKATGRKYGFIAHPENTGRSQKGRPSKWLKYMPQIKAMLRQGWLLNNILKESRNPYGLIRFDKENDS